jgi:acetyltransferase EpsM
MKIAIIGQGGHSKVIRELITQYDKYEIVAYLDDKFEGLSKRNNIVYGPISASKLIKDIFCQVKFFIAIGNNKIRKMIAENVNLPNDSFVSLIHPTATVSTSAKIAAGTVIMAHSVVNADAEIGNHTIINTGAIIEHDSKIGNYVHISPNATLTGLVEVKDGVHVGAGATIIPGVSIGQWTVIGAGATVIRSIPPFSTAVGVPAAVKYKEMREGV